MRGSWVMVLLAFCGAGFAVGAELPLPPSGRVLDEAGLFDRKPRKLEVISQRLNGFVEEHGLPVYLVIYGGLIGEQIDQRSRQLHEAWIGRGQDGLIVVWDSDTGELEFGLPRATYYDAGLRDGEVTRLPDQRVRPVLDEVRAQVEGIAGKTEYAERVSEVLVAQLDGMFRQGKQERGVPVGSVWHVTQSTPSSCAVM